MNDDETKELERQLAEVKARYSNTPLWLKAPNGEPSNLTPAEWAFVHTPYFKEKYGDWEALHSQSILQDEAVANLPANNVPIVNRKIIDSAIDWVREHPIGEANTKIGVIFITVNGIRDDFSHTAYPNKLYAIPAIKPALENGAYLGAFKDFTGKEIDNHYFAAPITIDRQRKCLFIRVRENVNGKNLYVHELFVDDEIKKAEGLNSALAKIGNRMQTVDPRQSRIKPSDFYRSLINQVLSVKPEMLRIALAANGEPDWAKEWSQIIGEPPTPEVGDKTNRENGEQSIDPAEIKKAYAKLANDSCAQADAENFGKWNAKAEQNRHLQAAQERIKAKLEKNPPSRFPNIFTYNSRVEKWQSEIQECVRQSWLYANETDKCEHYGNERARIDNLYVSMDKPQDTRAKELMRENGADIIARYNDVLKKESEQQARQREIERASEQSKPAPTQSRGNDFSR
ncbi:MAG: hypothetical protein LBP75_02825 [Planctomycetota bacterium]|jgi:hypothetical protein|nr:hypothetical protein [Planctomycetota bacterium]